ncbi:MAG: YbhB/YbcL family Raf kinase inhibitor-like protein, partial [Sulfitobacter sp.]
FFGPCPPVGREHTYTYTVHALDIEKLDAPEGATAPLTGFFINLHSIEQATLSVQAGPRSE